KAHLLFSLQARQARLLTIDFQVFPLNPRQRQLLLRRCRRTAGRVQVGRRLRARAGRWRIFAGAPQRLCLLFGRHVGALLCLPGRLSLPRRLLSTLCRKRRLLGGLTRGQFTSLLQRLAPRSLAGFTLNCSATNSLALLDNAALDIIDQRVQSLIIPRQLASL